MSNPIPVTTKLPKFAAFRIRSDGSPTGTVILMDGEPLHGVLRAQVTIEPKNLVTLALTMYAKDLEVEADLFLQREVRYTTYPTAPPSPEV